MELTIKEPEQQKVMFRFDNDEPEQMAYIYKGGKFSLTIEHGSFKFEKDGKIFELYIEENK